MHPQTAILLPGSMVLDNILAFSNRHRCFELFQQAGALSFRFECIFGTFDGVEYSVVFLLGLWKLSLVQPLQAAWLLGLVNHQGIVCEGENGHLPEMQSRNFLGQLLTSPQMCHASYTIEPLCQGHCPLQLMNCLGKRSVVCFRLSCSVEQVDQLEYTLGSCLGLEGTVVQPYRHFQLVQHHLHLPQNPQRWEAAGQMCCGSSSNHHKKAAFYLKRTCRQYPSALGCHA